MKRLCGDIFIAILICWGTAEAVGDARQDYQLAIKAIAEEGMTNEQIAEGQRRAIAWLAEFGRKH